MERNVARPREEVEPVKKLGHWHLVRRVPKEFAGVERRRYVTLSTKIAIVDDPKAIAAKRVVRDLDATLFAYWRSLQAGEAETAISFDDAVRITRLNGLPYVPHKELLLDVRGLVGRLEALESREEVRKPEAAAFIGAVEKPEIRLSQMIDIYKELNTAEVAQRAEAQQHRWDVNRKAAVDTFQEVLGSDKTMAELTFDDVMKVNDHLQKRIAAEEIVHDTANKCLSRVAHVFRDINIKKRLKLQDVFKDTRIAGGETEQRVAFPIKHVQEKILAPGMFDGINEEARDILYLVAKTGMRPSEAIYMLPERIRLKEELPFLEIRPDGRKLKTAASKREILLVGIGLEVMTRHPNGFTYYREKGSAALEALISKAPRTRKLILEDGQCFYSLRHTFEMRLQGVRAPEKVISYLMGHKFHRERYGFVPLEEKTHWIREIAFKSPYLP